MYDRYHLSRCDAMEFLVENFDVFPDTMPEGLHQRAEGISESIFKGWAFIVLDNGKLVFADCLSPCITKSDLEAVRETLLFL